MCWVWTEVRVCTASDRRPGHRKPSSHSYKNNNNTIVHFASHEPHRIKVLTMGQLISTFLGKRLYSFGISKTKFVIWKTHAIGCPLAWHVTEIFVLIIPFSTKAAFIFIKDDKTKTTSSFITFSAFMFCHSELFFSFPLSVFFSPSCRQHPAPPVTVLTELQERTLLQSSLWRISYKSL